MNKIKVKTTHSVLPAVSTREFDLSRLRTLVEHTCAPGSFPLRFSITKMEDRNWHCEVESVQGNEDGLLADVPSIFSFRQRRCERTSAFNAVMLIPTGIDCAIGGHAGDATPAARLLASVCDNLILHPNVVNASDINEQPVNCLYVEGSLICQLLMGTIALRKVRNNRILVITEDREDDQWAIDQVANTAGAACATLGACCSEIAVLKQGLSMTMGYAPSGRAIGEIEGFEELFALLRAERNNYDAVALSTRITPSIESSTLHQRYFQGEGPNPWGGVEAALTHTVSLMFKLPSAHAPTMSDLALRTTSFGRVDPRKAAEAISTSYMFCILKGLQRAPAIVANPDGLYDPAMIAAEDISCLVIPDGCVGLPTLAALVQEIPVIVVRNNTNLMKNDLQRLPFSMGKLWVVENYLEAAGLITALKAGIHPASLHRPLDPPCVL